MEKKYVLAIDQSTQGTKAILFDRVGNPVCRSDLAHRQLINEKGWVSHDLTEIYQNTIQVVKNLVEQAGIRQEEIACLGISNQRETAAAWDALSGKPLADAIVWQCPRAEAVCERIRNRAVMIPEGGETGADIRTTDVGIRTTDAGIRTTGGAAEIIRRKTGMQLSPYFSAAKYAWFQENVEAVQTAKKKGKLCLGTIDSWLLYQLTVGKVYATDYSNASRTQLFNIHTLQWDEEICAWFGIDRANLPTVHDSDAYYGETDFAGFFSVPIPICGVLGDSQAALYGQGCIEKGMVKATYGTGTSVMMNVGEKPIQSDLGLVTSLAWGMDGKVTYVLEGNINYTGAVITWLKNDMGLINSPDETGELAALANPHDMTYLVPAFSGLGAPYWKADAKAIICGMSRTTGKKEIVKAALESIAYQIADIVEMMKAEQVEDVSAIEAVSDIEAIRDMEAAKKVEAIRIKELCADGGPTGNQYLMKFQSDILGTKVTLPRCEASSALGAAFMAGSSAGFYPPDVIAKKTERNQYTPTMSKAEREQKYLGWKDAVNKILQ